MPIRANVAITKYPWSKVWIYSVFLTPHEHLDVGVLINNRLRCFAHGACFRVDTGDIEDHPGHGNLPSNVKIEFEFNHNLLHV